MGRDRSRRFSQPTEYGPEMPIPSGPFVLPGDLENGGAGDEVIIQFWA
jgi:hypothetical protein